MSLRKIFVHDGKNSNARDTGCDTSSLSSRLVLRLFYGALHSFVQVLTLHSSARDRDYDTFDTVQAEGNARVVDGERTSVWASIPPAVVWSNSLSSRDLHTSHCLTVLSH